MKHLHIYHWLGLVANGGFVLRELVAADFFSAGGFVAACCWIVLAACWEKEAQDATA